MIHVPLSDRTQLYTEFKRILRPNGVLLGTEGTDEWVGGHEDWLDSGVEMEWEIAGKEKTQQQLETAGFEVIKFVEIVDPLTEDSKKTFVLARTPEK